MKMINLKNLSFNITHFPALKVLAVCKWFLELSGLYLGLYVRYTHNWNMTLFVIGVLGCLFYAMLVLIFIFGTSKQFDVWKFICILWTGCIIGLVSFTNHELFKTDSFEEIMNFLLLSSIALHVLSQLVEYLFCQHNFQHVDLITLKEGAYFCGIMIASSILGPQFFTFFLYILSVGANLIALKLKSYLGVLHILLFPAASMLYLTLELRTRHFNYYALGCFFTNIFSAPLLSIIFSSHSALVRWRGFLLLSGLVRKCFLVLILIAQFSFMVVCASTIANHKEWYIVVFIFFAALLFWLCFHIIYIITAWKLMNRINICNKTVSHLDHSVQNYEQLLASKGLRHFGLLSRRLALINYVTSPLLFVISWDVKIPLSVSLLLLIMPLEGLFSSLLSEFADNIGGTCIGYAIVAPASASENPLLVSSRCTKILSGIQQFFTDHLIDNFGCDFSSSGLTIDGLKSKLTAFFDRRALEGPRYDTYLIYYSGAVNEGGDWDMHGSDSLCLHHIIQWWQQSCDIGNQSDSGPYSVPRLILLLDTYHSDQWLRLVKRLSSCFVAIQTCAFTKYANLMPDQWDQIGDFTSDFVADNDSGLTERADLVPWTFPLRAIKPRYAVSKDWTDFCLHLPTDAETLDYWHAHFPKLTWPFFRVSHLCDVGCAAADCFACIASCLRRKRMIWLPPHQIDTGHGFKLISY